MSHEQLFASFVLDLENGLEIALPANNVFEATKISEKIQPLPASAEFVEGIMQLRDEAIPVINLKKRLRLAQTTYCADAKIAVVTVFNQRFGLLFDDIKEVLRIDSTAISPINEFLQIDDRVISGLITIDAGSRTIELLNIDYLFSTSHPLLEGETCKLISETEEETITYSYSRYVIFSCAGQEYGVNVEHTQELCFLTDIDELYRSGNIEGALQLRGHTIPVVDANKFLTETGSKNVLNEKRRILVMLSGDLTFGFIVDEVLDIITVADVDILPMPFSGGSSVIGVYQYNGNRNIMLIDIDDLISFQADKLNAIGRINKGTDEGKGEGITNNISHNLITENCYLIFSINKNFAIEIKAVQEIIECNEVLSLPSAVGFNNGVINLRGRIIPVINLRRFYGYPDKNKDQGAIDQGAIDQGGSKLIICRGKAQIVALEVDSIVTIYKQEQYFDTPSSIKPQFSARKDTLDRLIEYNDGSGITEHVLVVNSHHLIQNHLGLKDEE